MAKNYIQPGEVIRFTAAAPAASGDFVAVGKLLGVSLTDVATGDTGDLAIRGVWLAPKPAGAITAGAPVTLAGVSGVAIAVAAAASGDPTVPVLLTGVAGTVGSP